MGRRLAVFNLKGRIGNCERVSIQVIICSKICMCVYMCVCLCCRIYVLQTIVIKKISSNFPHLRHLSSPIACTGRRRKEKKCICEIHRWKHAFSKIPQPTHIQMAPALKSNHLWCEVVQEVHRGVSS